LTRNWNRGRALRCAAPAAITSLALLVSACGSDDEGGGGGDGAGAGKSSGPATLKIGSLTPLTGELASFGQPWQQGIKLAVDEMSASGALPEGWKAEMISGDEKGDAQEGLQAARKMMDTDKVSGIVGPTSDTIVAMADTARDKETVVISPAAGTVSLDKLGGEWLYRTVASDATQGFAVLKWFADQGVESIGMMVQNDEATISPAAVLAKRFTDGGGEVVANVKYNPGQASYQAELQQVLDKKPSMIFLAGGQESGVTILKEAFQAGYDGKFLLTSETTVQEVIDAVGKKDMEGVQGMTPKADVTLAPYKKFAAAFEEANGEEPELFTANAYDATIMIGLAAVAAGSTDGAKIAEKLKDVSAPDGKKVTTFEEGAAALAAGEDIDYEGASGPVDFDETGSVADSYAILEIKAGKWEQVEFYSQEVIQQEKSK
jgi:branched-chain amino acid transport system substrate-binding protein/neutral amino acid transport system substrate-binding protein